MVFKLKELLKTAIFAILGVLIIIALIYFFLPKSSGTTSAYAPGVYTSELYLNDEKVAVEVTVSKNKIKAVNLIHTNETVPVFYPLLESAMDTIGKEIVKKQSLDVTLPPEAQVTGQCILDAAAKSLEQARVK